MRPGPRNLQIGRIKALRRQGGRDLFGAETSRGFPRRERRGSEVLLRRGALSIGARLLLRRSLVEWIHHFVRFRRAGHPATSAAARRGSKSSWCPVIAK